MEIGDLYHSDGSESDSASEVKAALSAEDSPSNQKMEDYYHSAHSSQAEGSDSSDAEKALPSSFITSNLNVDVPEFIPNNPVTKLLPSTDVTMTKKKIKSQFCNKSLQCSTTVKTSHKVTQTKISLMNGYIPNSDKSNCNCEHRQEAEILNAKIALLLKENKRINTDTEKLKEFVKQQQMENHKRLYDAESETNIIKTQFALYKEHSEEKLTQLQTTISTMEEKIAEKDNQIQFAQTMLMMKSLDYINLQENLIMQHMKKCDKMILSLSATLPTLTAYSYPTARECEKHIIKWQNQLQKAKQFAEKLKEHGTKLINGQFDNHSMHLPVPTDVMSELLNGCDLLHDNYITAVRSLLKENMLTHTQYNQWWSSLGYQQYKHPIMPVAQYCPNIPQPGPAIIIKDVTRNGPTSNNSNSSYITPDFATGLPVPAANMPKTESHKVESKIADTTTQNEQLKTMPEENKIPAVTKNFSDLSTTNDKPISDNPNWWSEKCDIIDPVKKSTPTVKPFKISSNRKVIAKQYESESSDSECTDAQTKEVKLPTSNQNEAAAPAKLDQQENADVVNDNLGVEESKVVIKIAPLHYVLPEAVKRSGPSFCNLYIYIRERIFGVSDDKVLAAITQVRRKHTKLSGMTKDTIVRAVKEELNASLVQ